MSTRLIPVARAMLPRVSPAPIARRPLRASVGVVGVRFASTSSYYAPSPAPKQGIKIGHLFLALVGVGAVATTVGLYRFYSNFTAFPNSSSHPIRTLLRRALTASSNGDQPRAATAFAAAYALALDLASRGELGTPEAALLKTTGIMIASGSMWEQVGQLSKAREAYDLAWNEVVARTQNGSAGQEDVLRGVAVALKIGDLWVEDKMDAQAEPYYVWSVEEMLRLGMSDSQKDKVAEAMVHDAVPAKPEAATKGEDGWDMPKWLGKVELVAGFERLGDLYTRTGKPEYASPALSTRLASSANPFFVSLGAQIRTTPSATSDRDSPPSPT